MSLTTNVTGQIIEKHPNEYRIKTANGIKVAQLKGRLFNSLSNRQQLPCVGDWIEGTDDGSLTQIVRIKDRFSLVSRLAPGRATAQQAIAANVDYVIIVLAVDGGRNYSDRLLERLLTIAWNSGATPLVVLNKSDLNEQVELIRMQAETIAPGIDIISCSAKEGNGINQLFSYLSCGKVGLFIGPSGVGKSTLTNSLLQSQVQTTNEIRQKDQRGRHTTSSSYLFELSNGAYIVDSPGIKEVQAWATREDVDSVFDEIATVSHECKYRDCQHQGEPGCAVQHHLEQGNITPERYDSYLNLQQEVAFVQRRSSENRSTERKHGKAFSRMVKSELSRKTMVRKAVG